MLLHHKACHEGIWGSAGLAPRILNQGTRWCWVISFTVWPLYSREKSLRYTYNRRLVGSQLVWTFWRRKYSLPPAKTQSKIHWMFNPLRLKLYLLSYPNPLPVTPAILRRRVRSWFFNLVLHKLKQNVRLSLSRPWRLIAVVQTQSHLTSTLNGGER